MKRLQTQTEPDSSIKIIKVVKIGSVILILFLVFEVWMVNRLSTMGNKISQLSEVKRNLELENQLLESQIAEKSSLQVIEQKASRLGFKSIDKVEALKDQNLAAAVR